MSGDSEASPRHALAERVLALLPLLGAVPVALWLVGAYADDAARIVAGVSLIGFVLTRKTVPARPRPGLTLALNVGWISAPAIVAVHQLAKVLAGRQGIDFAIFAQVVHAIASSGVPTTTLLGPEPVNFLAHHFAPILYVPGGLSFLGLPAPVSLVLVHGACFGAALWGLHRFCLVLGLDRTLAAAWTFALALAPSVRPEMLWGVHDELFALPLLAWAFVALAQRRPMLSLGLAAACSLAKESFFAVPMLWSVLVVLELRASGTRVTRGQALALTGASLGSAALGAFYVFGQPLWLGAEFHHFDKFGAAAWEPGALRTKLLFLLSLVVPLAGLPLTTKRGLAFCLPAMPFLLLGLVASDPEMYRPTGYHAVLPQFVLGFAGALGLRALRLPSGRVPVALALLLSAQLTWGAHGLWKPLKEAVAQSWYPTHEFDFLPPDTLVAVDPAAALALLNHRRTTRLWAANESAPVGLQMVIARPGGWEAPAPALAATMSPCGRASAWLTLCAAGASEPRGPSPDAGVSPPPSSDHGLIPP